VRLEFFDWHQQSLASRSQWRRDISWAPVGHDVAAVDVVAERDVRLLGHVSMMAGDSISRQGNEPLIPRRTSANATQ
jgi:hypothetical protein